MMDNYGTENTLAVPVSEKENYGNIFQQFIFIEKRLIC